MANQSIKLIYSFNHKYAITAVIIGLVQYKVVALERSVYWIARKYKVVPKKAAILLRTKVILSCWGTYR